MEPMGGSVGRHVIWGVRVRKLFMAVGKSGFLVCAGEALDLTQGKDSRRAGERL